MVHPDVSQAGLDAEADRATHLCPCGADLVDGTCPACAFEADLDLRVRVAFLVVSAAIARVNAGQVAKHEERAAQPIGRAWA
jgi:hypothetical protein